MNTGLEAAGGKPLAAEVLDRAWEQPAVTSTRSPRAWRSRPSTAFDAGHDRGDATSTGIYDLAAAQRGARRPRPGHRSRPAAWARSERPGRKEHDHDARPATVEAPAQPRGRGRRRGRAGGPGRGRLAALRRDRPAGARPGRPDGRARASSSACSAPPGCGKSTLLNLIAGLTEPTSGTVEVVRRPAGPDVPGAGAAARGSPPRATSSSRCGPAGSAARSAGRRPSGCSRWSTSTGTARKRVHELSGGMRQRVALARALAQDSSVLLMDEPFAALDAITRDVLHEELTRVWAEQGLSVVFVTHNVREAVRLGQRVVLLSSRPGRVVREWQVDIPQPRTHRVARGRRARRRDHRASCTRRSAAMATDLQRPAPAPARGRREDRPSPPASTRSTTPPQLPPRPGARAGGSSGRCCPPLVFLAAARGRLAARLPRRGQAAVRAARRRRTSARRSGRRSQDGRAVEAIWTSLQPRRGRLRACRSSIGTPLGLAMWWSRWLRAAIGPIVSGLQTLPSVAWVPAAIIWFGLTDATIYTVVLLGAVPSIANGLLTGMNQVPPLFHRVGQVLGLLGAGPDPVRAAAGRAARATSAACGRAGRSPGARSWPPSSSPTRRQLGQGLGQLLNLGRELSQMSLVITVDRADPRGRHRHRAAGVRARSSAGCSPAAA